MSEESTKKKSSGTDWKDLRHKRDAQIDYSDIPETEPEFWENAGVFFPNQTVRVDEDILNWFRERESDYEAKINDILRTYVHDAERDSV